MLLTLKNRRSYLLPVTILQFFHVVTLQFHCEAGVFQVVSDFKA